MNYTKGEWAISHREGNIWITSDDKKLGYVIASIESSSIDDELKEEAEANAKLIAASKDLLGALLAVYQDIDIDKHGSSELNQIVQQAIQKATS